MPILPTGWSLFRKKLVIGPSPPPGTNTRSPSPLTISQCKNSRQTKTAKSVLWEWNPPLCATLFRFSRACSHAFRDRSGRDRFGFALVPCGIQLRSAGKIRGNECRQRDRIRVHLSIIALLEQREIPFLLSTMRFSRIFKFFELLAIIR